MIVFALLLSQQLFAATTNPYAPTLNDVVVLFDVADKEYSPFLFHALMGETLRMKMDESCENIEVTQQGQV